MTNAQLVMRAREGDRDAFDRMLEVNGERVVIASNYQKSNSSSDLAQLQSVLDSIQIVP